MRIYEKKQITVIIEKPLLERLTAVLRRDGVSGYTVVPAIEGMGADGTWSREGAISETETMVQVVCVIDPARLDAVLDDVFALVSKQRGMVTVQDVGVIRPERF